MTSWPPPQLDAPSVQRGLRTLVHGGQTYIHTGDLADYLASTGAPDDIATAFDLIGQEMRRIGAEAAAKGRGR
jgi:hypothetical protein